MQGDPNLIPIQFPGLFSEQQLSACKICLTIALARPGTAPPKIENAGKRKTTTAGFEFEEGDEEDGDEKKQTGRRKIKIEYIADKSRRHITFSKRKAGIMKKVTCELIKAYELSTLTGTQVLLLVASETGHVYTFATQKLQPLITKPEGKNMIQSCLNAPDAVSMQSATPLTYPERYGSAPPSRPLSSMSYQDKNQGLSSMALPHTPANSIGINDQDSLLMPGPGSSYNSTTYNTSYNSAGLPLSPSNVYGYQQQNQNYLSQNPQYSHLGMASSSSGRNSPSLPLRNASPAHMMMRESTSTELITISSI